MIKKIIVTSLVGILAGCGGGSDSKGGDDGGANAADGIGANAVKLPSLSGLEMVTHIEPYDLNKDGRMDLIMFLAPPGYASGARIVALMNTASGFTFDDQYFPLSLYTGDERWMESAVLIDLNGDGHKDIVPHLDNGNSRLAPLVWNDQSKKFDALTDEVFSEGLTGYVPIDADMDGDIDLLTHEWSTGRWYLLENDGTGRFEKQSEPVFTADTSAGFIYQPIVMDVDNDGRSDLIFGGPKWVQGWVDEKVPLTVMLSGVAGWTQANNATVFSGNEPSFTHLRLTRTADFNNDGHTDIAIANHGYDAGGLSGEYNGLLLNTGTGGFTVNTSSPAFNYRGFTHAMAVGDVDNDGDIDIVYADITGTDVDYTTPIRLLYNDGNGNFTHKAVTLSHEFALTSAKGWTTAALADLDGDGYLDLVVGGQGNQADSFVFYNDGTGFFR